MPQIKLEIRTEEIDEILGKTPNRIIRWGVSLIFLIVLILLIGSWFFKYPDFISSTIEITTTNPPADVKAKVSGKIDSIFVANNEIVKSSQILAIIETPANYEHIKLLSILLDSISTALNKKDSIRPPENLMNKPLNLGELQTSFSIFLSAYNSLANYLRLAYYSK